MNKEKFVELLSFLFLFCLGLLAFQEIFSAQIFVFDIQNYELLAKIMNNIKAVQYEIVFFAIVIWSLLFYWNRDKIESIEEEQEKNLEEEKKRKAEFGSKFPVMSRIPILGWIVKWIYWEGLGYSIIFISILSLSWFLRFYNLWELWFHWDEFFHQLSADWISKTWLPTLPNWLLYVRWIITSYLSYFWTLFFNWEFWYRIFQTLFWFSLMIYSFFLVKLNFWKKVWLLYLFIVWTELWILEFSRYLRFYDIQMFLTIVILLLLIQKDIFKSFYKFLLLFIFVFISFLESQSAFFLIPIIFGVLIYRNIKTIKQSFHKVILIGLLFIIPIFSTFLINFSNNSLNSLPNSETKTQHESFIEKGKNAIINNINFDKNLFFIKSLFLTYPILFILAIIYIIAFLYLKTWKKSVILIGSWLFFLFILTILQSKAQQRILSFLLPLFILISTFSLYIFSKINKKVFLWSIFFIVLIDIFPSLMIPFRNYGNDYHNIKKFSASEPYYPDYSFVKNINFNKDTNIIVSRVTELYTYYLFNNKSLTSSNSLFFINKNLWLNSATENRFLSIKDLNHLIEIISTKKSYVIFPSMTSPTKIIFFGKELIIYELNDTIRLYIEKTCEVVYKWKDSHSNVFLCNNWMSK